jgi:hypothetical protein
LIAVASSAVISRTKMGVFINPVLPLSNYLC